MKRILVIMLTVFCMGWLVSCGATEEQESVVPEGSDISLIAYGNTIEDGAFNQAAWECIQKFSQEYQIPVQNYITGENEKSAYLELIENAVDDGAKFIIMTGSHFETTAYEAQKKYPDIKFLLIDGVPHDEKNNYETATNTISVIFAEEEAGYLAGYAAVKDGYKKLGFLGGEEVPAVKRYGCGFIQGAAAAAAEQGMKVQMNYRYTGTLDESETVEQQAGEWYQNGTEIIFACGGSLGKSVMKAAEASSTESVGKKVIGVDIDQSSLSETIVTSAEKQIATSIEGVLKDYKNDIFAGGNALNYSVRNQGIGLEMEHARFQTFQQQDYDAVYQKLENGKIDLKKDTDAKSLEELSGRWVVLKE